MMRTEKMQEMISWVLLTGILLASLLVLTGGITYLLQYGGQTLPLNHLQANAVPTNLMQIWDAALNLESLGIIQLGLVVLVVTQFARVALLLGFYALIRDYWFTLISLFIFLVLVYSLIWH